MGKGLLHKPHLSIIIPAYKAESFIVKSVKEVDLVLGRLTNSYEIICVVDGKVDDTFSLVKELTEKNRKIKVLSYKNNRGKGYAVRYGMMKARGKLVGFIDAGLEIDPESIVKLLEVQKKENADIVVGSKRHPNSKVEYPTLRQIISVIYYFLVKILFRPKVTDTQAGVKIFKGSVIKKILPRLHINGFAFDIEVLMQANILGYKKIHEAPIFVKMVKAEKSSTLDTSSKIFSASIKMFIDTVGLFFRLKK